MLAPHTMTINTRKRLQAHPTNVRPTHRTFHVIASFILLDRDMTTRALLDIAHSLNKLSPSLNLAQVSPLCASALQAEHILTRQLGYCKKIPSSAGRKT
jgi:hypothetical protein